VAETGAADATQGLAARLGRLARGERAVLAEVARDESATGPALQVALGTAALEALGDGGGATGVLGSLAENALGWGLAVVLIHGGALLLGLEGRLAPLFRALGFASLPFALGLLAPLPLLGGLAVLAQWALLAIAFALAVAESLEAEMPVAAGLAVVGLGLGGGVAGALL